MLLFEQQQADVDEKDSDQYLAGWFDPSVIQAGYHENCATRHNVNRHLRKRLGYSKGVTTAAIARDDSNLRLPREPGLCRSGLAVG